MDYILLVTSIFSLSGIVFLFVKGGKVHKITIKNPEVNNSVIPEKISRVLSDHSGRIVSLLKSQNGVIGKLKNKHRNLVRTVQGKVSAPSKGTASVFLRDLATEKRKIE